ncbi:MAG: sigma-70 family RNA polymerase sigma factor [Wolbachia endosymbiont of Homalodisca vitripennis]|nr:sigma-70 family RNA polymerase sigma factor [Wolbachia endosymbiont of Homalodisca vitripennis]MCJ7454552.1 sigma-70 family RNA polymerase sigma factor [Wolbachia endosymbiont of Homalodisca vitripennis]MCJ7475438.1 sigma-70 family RNA polymerase sigma factor [Wolbachia endosymbiont of Homalodisca vitripennis]
MHSKNSYIGINPKVVKHIRHYSKLLKRGKAFAYKDIEDVEQDLLLDCLPGLNELEGHFIKQYVKCRALNLKEKELCKKRTINFVDETLYEESDESLEYSSAVRIDVNEAIAKLPRELRKICKLLAEDHSICEISRKTGIPKSTLYDTVNKLRKEFSHLKTYLKRDF